MKSLNALCSIVVLVFAACGGQAPAPAGPSPQAQARAQADLDAYNQLVAAGSHELAITMGRSVLNRYPGTPQAAEVARTLPEVQARAAAARESQRLASLWSYQLSEAGGGKQSTASIYESANVPAADKVRLVLRRHAEWGQSVYLFASGQGFRCGRGCTLAARFDGAPVSLAAHAPETGEPAVFINDDTGFLARLEQKPQRIEIDASLHSRGPVTLLFETGGYDPAKFVPLAEEALNHTALPPALDGRLANQAHNPLIRRSRVRTCAGLKAQAGQSGMDLSRPSLTDRPRLHHAPAICNAHRRPAHGLIV